MGEATVKTAGGEVGNDVLPTPRLADGWLQAAHAKYGPVDRYLAGLIDG